MRSVGQKSHLLGFQRRFPLEVESRLWGGGTKALVGGFGKAGVYLNSNLGHVHVALREAITAEVHRLAAIKEVAKAAAKGAVAQGAAPMHPQWAGPAGTPRTVLL